MTHLGLWQPRCLSFVPTFEFGGHSASIRSNYGFQKRKRPSAMPNSSQLPDRNDSLSNRVLGDSIHSDSVRLLAISELDERLGRYRLAQPKLEQQMLKSLRDYGQMSPVVVTRADAVRPRKASASYCTITRAPHSDNMKVVVTIISMNRPAGGWLKWPTNGFMVRPRKRRWSYMPKRCRICSPSLHCNSTRPRLFIAS